MFDNITFNEEEHRYFSNNKQVGLSVTGLIHQYSQEFDEETIAERVANKQNRPVNQILDEWHRKRDYSCVKGNEIHKFAQSLWIGNNYITNYDEIDLQFQDQLKADLEILKPQAIAFYEEHKDTLELIKAEQYIYDEGFDLAGSIDLLCKNKLTGDYVIIDFKSNDNFYKDAYSNMKVPLQHLEDSNISHYSLQLEIYKQIFERNTKEKVEDTFIVYFNLESDTFEIIEPLNVKKEAKKILENRRIKNMNSVPVLLIGKSGSGKSTSLRNFTKDEVAVVNVLGKPLPFKTDINAPKIDDYKIILEKIAKTDKKVIFIDDANYLIVKEFMDKRSVKGYEKFNEMGGNFYDLINGIKNIQGGKTVYLSMHEETDEFGDVQPKTIGKMLNDKINIQGMFTVCIRSMFDSGKYIFRLKTNGQDCVKTPFDMVDVDEMENDLKAFDKIVREYYNLDKVEKEMKEGDK
jgi:hypothetical protein